MSKYEVYAADVLAAGIKLSPILFSCALDFIRALWDEDVVIDKIWFARSGYPYIVMHAICYDENDEPCEAVGSWEYIQANVGSPAGPYYEMVDVELRDMVGGYD